MLLFRIFNILQTISIPEAALGVGCTHVTFTFTHGIKLKNYSRNKNDAITWFESPPS